MSLCFRMDAAIQIYAMRLNWAFFVRFYKFTLHIIQDFKSRKKILAEPRAGAFGRINLAAISLPFSYRKITEPKSVHKHIANYFHQKLQQDFFLKKQIITSGELFSQKVKVIFFGKNPHFFKRKKSSFDAKTTIEISIRK